MGAGFSRRFGTDKRLQAWRGSTVAEQTCDTYQQAFPALRVVIRPDDKVLRVKLARYTDDIVASQHAHLGMGHSLAAGIAGLDWDWAFVGLLDMPFVKVTTLLGLIEHARTLSAPGIIRPRLRQPGKDGIPYGHPIGWHRRYFDALCQCTGDSGARDLLNLYKADTLEVEVEDPGIVQDIDTPQDLP